MDRCSWCAAATVAAALAGSLPLGAQTVRPAVVEYPEEARGRFELVNETLFPMSVVLEPHGFKVLESGELVELPIDSSHVNVKLSTMSFRIPPRQSYTVVYEATASQLPAWFLITSTMSGARTQSGLNVRIELPHVVYLLQKQPLRKPEVAVRAFEFDSSAKRVRIELENTSASLGRVMSSEVSSDAKDSRAGGAFPLFPLSRRFVELPWDAKSPPAKLVLRFDDFTIEARVKPRSQ